MSKIFSEIHQLPGNSGKSSTASGMTRYAVNKTFAKSSTMPQSAIRKAKFTRLKWNKNPALFRGVDAPDVTAKPSKVETRVEYFDTATPERTSRRVNPLRSKRQRVERDRTQTKMPDDYADVSSSGGGPSTTSSSIPPLPATGTTPTKAIAPGAVAVEVPEIIRNLAEIAGETARWRKDWTASSLSNKSKKNYQTASNKFRESLRQQYESELATEAANKSAQDTVDFIMRHHRKWPLVPVGLAAGLYYGIGALNNDDDKKSKPSSKESWWGGNEKTSKDVASVVEPSFGVAIPKKMNPAFYQDLTNRQKERRDKIISDYLRSKRVRPTPSVNQFSTKTQKRMIQKGVSKSSSDKNSLDSVVDFINQYITPNSNFARKATDFTSQKTKQYAPIVSEKIDEGVKYGDKAWRESKPLREQAMREGKKFADASVESVKNAYGNALNYGKQFVDLAMSESAKGLGGRSRSVNLKIPKSDYLGEIDLSFSIPTMNELHERAKTVGARKQTGRYDESNEIERALQFVRDWGEENLPTPKKEIKGLPKDFQNKRGRVRVQDGEFVPYWQGVDMGNKEPKGIKREDVVYGGGSLGGNPVKSKKTKPQEWDTATMKPKGSWKPQAKVEEKFVYNPQLKRYVSTRAKDSNDITEFERYNDGKSVKKGSDMRKEMRAIPKSERRGMSFGGSRAMLKALYKNFGQMPMPKPPGKPIPPSPRPQPPRNPGPIGPRPKPNPGQTPPITGQMPSPGNMGSGGVFTPMGKRMMKALYKAGLGMKTPPKSYSSTGGNRSMMKSVSSMRSAGTRHLVGGYRGGSKLHKAATPTLATRNFRGKFE